MFEEMQSYIEKHRMIEKDDIVILGLSGGPDSMCLYHLLLRYREKIPFSLRVVHINHMLRKEAKEEALFVEEQCRKHQVPCDIVEIDVTELAKKEKVSTEEAGRMARYHTFRRILKLEEELTTKKGKIAIAHNKNDVAETLLFHLFRGAGMQGLTGIAPVNGNIIRPILCLTREEIELYLKKENIPYCIDQSNMEDVYTRNRIRKHILPYAEREISAGATNHIFDTAEMIASTQDYILTVVEAEKKRTIKKENDKIFIKNQEFQLLHDTIKNELLRSVLFEVAGRQKDFTKSHIEDLKDLFEKQVGKEIDLPYQIKASKTYDGVWVRKKEELSEYQARKLEIGKQSDPVLGEIFVEIMDVANLAEIPEKKCTKWFDYDKIKRYLCLRTRSEGDYFVINKQGNKKKLKEYMINQKIPKEERKKMVLLADEDHIVWVPGYRISEKYKVSEKTKRVIKIYISSLKDK